MGTVYDNIRNMSASALLGIKRSASKQDLQNILNGPESASNPDAKTKSPEFDSSMLTPSMIGKAEDNLKTVSSTESMSQFLGQVREGGRVQHKVQRREDLHQFTPHQP